MFQNYWSYGCFSRLSKFSSCFGTAAIETDEPIALQKLVCLGDWLRRSDQMLLWKAPSSCPLVEPISDLSLRKMQPNRNSLFSLSVWWMQRYEWSYLAKVHAATWTFKSAFLLGANKRRFLICWKMGGICGTICVLPFYTGWSVSSSLFSVPKAAGKRKESNVWSWGKERKKKFMQK